MNSKRTFGIGRNNTSRARSMHVEEGTMESSKTDRMKQENERMKEREREQKK